ncbi:unnamed protein product [Angiostrongylus costaricensis]|uniref:Piwi domain-containing protein n=1 Tax=Angiostrongylus costaricensis TaxID=334426 RepID=A0A0R3PJZ9_ANGCS|nr:unnamed protein product [Angiostrongylus costaricensis]
MAGPTQIFVIINEGAVTLFPEIAIYTQEIYSRRDASTIAIHQYSAMKKHLTSALTTASPHSPAFPDRAFFQAIHTLDTYRFVEWDTTIEDTNVAFTPASKSRFFITYKDQDDLYRSFKENLKELGIPPETVYHLDYDGTHEEINSAEKLSNALTNDEMPLYMILPDIPGIRDERMSRVTAAIDSINRIVAEGDTARRLDIFLVHIPTAVPVTWTVFAYAISDLQDTTMGQCSTTVPITVFLSIRFISTWDHISDIWLLEGSMLEELIEC